MIPLTQDKGSHSAESSPTMSRLFPPTDVKRRHSLLMEAKTGSDVIDGGSGLLSSMAAATSAAAFVAAFAVPADNSNPNVEVTRVVDNVFHKFGTKFSQLGPFLVI